MSQLDFYFDIISPYAFFAFKRLNELPSSVNVTLKPVLFAGLLGHWESKGPAEIPPKRIFTYQYTHWYAAKHNIQFCAPPAHPFNPLPGLRLILAAGNTMQAIDRVFSFVWAEGCSFDTESDWNRLVTEIGLENPTVAIASPEVKSALRDNTEQAIAAQVFGVPSYVIDGHVFWGMDALPMAIDYANDPGMMDVPEMLRLSSLPSSATRKF